ncbi:hypothetical protein EVA_06606 [gut metagenome]|uniref:Uncharacterized protein n=1 Tax=gut metagenome TaxID=749906 RepID=J9GD71_9ZZZZ
MKFQPILGRNVTFVIPNQETIFLIKPSFKGQGGF